MCCVHFFHEIITCPKAQPLQHYANSASTRSLHLACASSEKSIAPVPRQYTSEQGRTHSVKHTCTHGVLGLAETQGICARPVAPQSAHERLCVCVQECVRLHPHIHDHTPNIHNQAQQPGTLQTRLRKVHGIGVVSPACVCACVYGNKRHRTSEQEFCNGCGHWPQLRGAERVQCAHVCIDALVLPNHAHHARTAPRRRPKRPITPATTSNCGFPPFSRVDSPHCFRPFVYVLLLLPAVFVCVCV